MKILIAGDYAPKARVQKMINSNDFSFFDEIIGITSLYDFSILNLEAPIAGIKCSYIKKSGPALRTTPKVVDSIKYAGFDSVTLANNHFRDCGDDGVNTTINLLKENGIKTMGGGASLSESQKNLIIEISGKKIGFINVCEHEFSIATTNHGGSAPLDIIDVLNRIRTLKDESDYIIVIIHGGHEHYQLPSPRMKKLYRCFADAGANIVVNHHQHCYSGYEIYKGTPIFYGLGNFCFDWESKRNSLWNVGYMLGLDIRDKISIELIPYEQCNEDSGIKLFNGDKKNDVLQDVERLNHIISDDSKLEACFADFCIKNTHSVKTTFSPLKGKILRGLAKYHLLPYFLSESKSCAILNFIECEAHRDVVCNVLKRKIK